MPRTLLALALVCAALGTTSAGHADGDVEPAQVEAARADFAEGTSQFRAKKWAEALKSFEHSYGGVASPNAQLMIARCLRELGRTPEAATAFASTESEARRRVARGESKYADTANAAATEGAALRASLGELHIHVAHANGASLVVDRKVVPLSKDGDATVFHDPGSVPITVVDAGGTEHKQSATVAAGAAVEVSVALADPGAKVPTPATSEPSSTTPAPAKKSDEPHSFPSWFWPGVLASGGTTIVAGGVGIGFGLSSKSTFNTLYSRCGPNNCGPADRADADSGSRAQTIANVSFVVGAVAIVATAVIVYLGLTSSGPRASSL